MVADPAGNLYVAASDLGVVLKVDTASNVTVYAGKALPVGPSAASGDGGPATSARFTYPTALTLDAAGNLYIADQASATVREVDAATGTVRTIAGVLNQTGDGTSTALLQFPTALALDGVGNLFIGDLDRVLKLNLTNNQIQVVAGTKIPHCDLLASRNCPATDFALGIAAESGSALAFSNGQLYIACSFVNSFQNLLSGSLIQVDQTTGTAIVIAGGGTFAGTSSTYPAVGQFLAPAGVTTDTVGNIYFTDIQTRHILRYAADTHLVDSVAGTGKYGVGGDGGPATSAMLGAIQAITLTPQGSIVFWDTYRIRAFPIGGNILTIAGNGHPNYYGDQHLATAAGLDHPEGAVADPQGNLYIADFNGAIRRVDGATGGITTVAGPGTPGYGSPDGPALQAQLGPISLAVDNTNHLYVTNYGALQVVDLSSGTISTLIRADSPDGQISAFSGLAFDGQHTLYAGFIPYSGAGGEEVIAVDTTTGAKKVVAGSANGFAYPGPSGDGGPATQAFLGAVAGLALDEHGNLYVADTSLNDVRVINLSTATINSTAGQFSLTGGYSGDGGPATEARLNHPGGLVYDGTGHLLVADSSNQVIRQVDLTNGIITTAAGNGQSGFSGDGGAATLGMLAYPRSVGIDPSGNLFIADLANNRIRRVLLHPARLNAILTASSSTANAGDSLTFTATYSGLSFGVAPTGTVTFLAGSTTLGSADLTAASDASGSYTATLTTTSVPAGTTSVTAQYSGDTHYASSLSNAIDLAIVAPQPSYVVAATPAALTLRPGASGNVTFTITPVNGFHQAIAFSCDGTTLPKGVTCSFSPASVTPAGSTAITSTLTVQTTGADDASFGLETKRLHRWWIPCGESALALLLVGMPRTRRRVRHTWMSLILLVACLSGMLGCGGSSSDSGNPQSTHSTPAGTYSLKVTAFAGTGTSALVQPVTVSLIVTQ